MSVERIPVTIKPERVNRQVTLMKDRLHGQGLSVGSCCNIPVKCNHFYLPLTKEGASDKLVNLDVIRTMYALEELNDNVMGMIGYAGTFKKTPDTLKGLGIENVNRIDTGIWEHLYELGRNSEPKISEEEIKKDMVKMALDPKARSVRLSKWATEVRCPKWLDKEKSTSIEILAAAYATDNDELQKKIKDNIKSDDDGNKRRASYDVSTGEITVKVKKMAKWFAPLLMPFILAVNMSYIDYAVAQKIITGKYDDKMNIYRNGIMRKSDEKNGALEIFKRLLDEKPQVAPQTTLPHTLPTETSDSISAPTETPTATPVSTPIETASSAPPSISAPIPIKVTSPPPLPPTSMVSNPAVTESPSAQA